jgi:hypothetical protein
MSWKRPIISCSDVSSGSLLLLAMVLLVEAVPKVAQGVLL